MFHIHDDNLVNNLIFIGEKLIDLDSPSTTAARTPKPRKAIPENLSQTGKEMWELLKDRKGLVVIGKYRNSRQPIVRKKQGTIELRNTYKTRNHRTKKHLQNKEPSNQETLIHVHIIRGKTHTIKPMKYHTIKPMKYHTIKPMKYHTSEPMKYHTIKPMKYHTNKTMTGQNKNTYNQTIEIPYKQNHDRTKQKHTQSNQ